MIGTPDWMPDSLCAGKNGDIWFPPFETDRPEAYYYVARQVCNLCPVWKECLNLGKSETYGMWGGLTPQERLPLQRQDKGLHLAEHGTSVRYRQGCSCKLCEKAHSTRVRNPKVLECLPKQKEEFDILDIANTLQRL